MNAPSLPRSGLRGFLLVLLRLRDRYRIQGDSMEPVLRDGDHVVVDRRAYRNRAPREGDLVLVRHPLDLAICMVKRVHRVDPDGRLEVRGDNPGASTDSRSFGTVRPEDVLGKVVATLP